MNNSGNTAEQKKRSQEHSEHGRPGEGVQEEQCADNSREKATEKRQTPIAAAVGEGVDDLQQAPGYQQDAEDAEDDFESDGKHARQQSLFTNK